MFNVNVELKALFEDFNFSNKVISDLRKFIFHVL